jgi:radical SAM protein with 4Fe4S-binding SPASM domain
MHGATTATFTSPARPRIFGDARDLGCRVVHFLGGGEPLIDPRFPVAAALCAELGMGLVITTNGSHLGSRLGSLAGSNVLALLVSIDSHIADEHDAIRKIPGLWSRAVQGVEAWRPRFPAMKVVFNHVVTRHNIGNIQHFFAFAGSLGGGVNLIPVKDAPQLAATPAQWIEFQAQLDTLGKSAAAKGIPMYFDLEDAAAWTGSSATLHDGHCVFPRYALYVDFPTGSVFPCDCTVHRAPQQRFELGNVWQQGLADIWAGSAIAKLRAILQSPTDPGCKADCDWNNRSLNRALLPITTAFVPITSLK